MASIEYLIRGMFGHFLQELLYLLSGIVTSYDGINMGLHLLR